MIIQLRFRLLDARLRCRQLCLETGHAQPRQFRALCNPLAFLHRKLRDQSRHIDVNGCVPDRLDFAVRGERAHQCFALHSRERRHLRLILPGVGPKQNRADKKQQDQQNVAFLQYELRRAQ